MRKRGFGHVHVEEAISCEHVLEALGEIWGLRLPGYQWGSAVETRSAQGVPKLNALQELEPAGRSLGAQAGPA